MLLKKICEVGKFLSNFYIPAINDFLQIQYPYGGHRRFHTHTNVFQTINVTINNSIKAASIKKHPTRNKISGRVRAPKIRIYIYKDMNVESFSAHIPLPFELCIARVEPLL
jgi:hypothetical protein